LVKARGNIRAFNAAEVQKQMDQDVEKWQEAYQSSALPVTGIRSGLSVAGAMMLS
jgi:hypothetical protein